MSEEPEVPDTEELLSALLIQNIRNYDVMMHLLKHFDKEAADRLYDFHKDFNLWGPMPFQVEE